MNAASEQYVLQRLVEHFEWSTKYLRLVREGKLDEAEKMTEEYETRLKELEDRAFNYDS